MTILCDSGYRAVEVTPAICLGGAFSVRRLGTCVKSSSGSGTLSGGAIAAIIIVMFALLAGLGFVRWRYRKRVTTLRNTLLYKNLLLDAKNTELDEYEDAWKITWEEVELNETIGRSTMHCVFDPVNNL